MDTDSAAVLLWLSIRDDATGAFTHEPSNSVLYAQDSVADILAEADLQGINFLPVTHWTETRHWQMWLAKASDDEADFSQAKSALFEYHSVGGWAAFAWLLKPTCEGGTAEQIAQRASVPLLQLFVEEGAAYDSILVALTKTIEIVRLALPVPPRLALSAGERC